MTKQEAIAFASAVRSQYPQHIYLEDVLESANADGLFKNETEMMICWGIFMKTMPRKVGA